MLRQGLQAATILLSIMTTPSIDRRVITEDTIDSIISLMRNHTVKNVVWALGNSGHTAAYSNHTGEKVGNGKGKDKVEGSAAKKVKKSKTSTNQQNLIKYLKKIYKHVFSTVGTLANLMERLDTLIQNVSTLEDQPLLSICSSALSSLTIASH